MSSIAHTREAAFTIQVEVNARKSQQPQQSNQEDDHLRGVAQKLEEALAKIAPIVLDVHWAQPQRQQERLVEFMLGDHSPTPIDIVRAGMQANALRAVFDGTEWLTAAQMAQLAGLGNANPSGTVNRWKQRRKLFALKHKGQHHYPRYLLDEGFRPLPAAEQLLEMLAEFSPNRLASWFESRNGLLTGQRPRELLTSDPKRVLEAARQTLDAERYTA